MVKKRAMGLSINTIIIAALGFFVLVIVAVIFRTHIQSYSEGYKKTAKTAIDSAEGGCRGPMFSGIERECFETPPEKTEGTWKPAEGKCDDKDGKKRTCWEFVKTESKTETTSGSQTTPQK